MLNSTFTHIPCNSRLRNICADFLSFKPSSSSKPHDLRVQLRITLTGGWLADAEHLKSNRPKRSMVENVAAVE